MNIVLSYIGKMPDYIIECIYQIRLFSNSNIYLIMNDLKSPLFLQLLKLKVKIISYDFVYSTDFNDCFNKNSKKILISPHKDREELFIRSIERFFILQNAMKLYNLSDVLFMELDNLIYDNPEKWLNEFKKHNLCFMFDNIDRCSAGLMYVKNSNSIQGMLKYFIDYIEDDNNNYIDEMTLLFRYYMHVKDNKLFDIIQLLPTYWSDENISEYSTKNYGKYGNSIFDAAAIGIHLFGVDPCLLNNTDFQKDYKKEKWNPSCIDYTKQEILWKLDDDDRLIPYIFTGNKWAKINNLHLHCKNLKLGLSKPYFHPTSLFT
jgi:hypothetical protein